MGSNPAGCCVGRLLKNLSLHFGTTCTFRDAGGVLGGFEVEETTQVSQCGPTYLGTEAWRLLIVLLPDCRSGDGSLTRLRPGETGTVHSDLTERRTRER
jgi:hypothetical protein